MQVVFEGFEAEQAFTKGFIILLAKKSGTPPTTTQTSSGDEPDPNWRQDWDPDSNGYNSELPRRVLGLVVGDQKAAHHIIHSTNRNGVWSDLRNLLAKYQIPINGKSGVPLFANRNGNVNTTGFANHWGIGYHSNKAGETIQTILTTAERTARRNGGSWKEAQQAIEEALTDIGIAQQNGTFRIIP